MERQKERQKESSHYDPAIMAGFFTVSRKEDNLRIGIHVKLTCIES